MDTERNYQQGLTGKGSCIAASQETDQEAWSSFSVCLGLGVSRAQEPIGKTGAYYNMIKTKHRYEMEIGISWWGLLSSKS
jgi:hypothetical protein